MPTLRLWSVLLALSLAACAAAPGDEGSDPEGLDEQTGDGGTRKDAGRSTVSKDGGSSSALKSDAATPATASNPLAGLAGILGGGAKDAGKSTVSDGGVDMCADKICFDIFDCAIFHTDSLDCGFTSCTGFVCAK